MGEKGKRDLIWRGNKAERTKKSEQVPATLVIFLAFHALENKSAGKNTRCNSDFPKLNVIPEKTDYSLDVFINKISCVAKYCVT